MSRFQPRQLHWRSQRLVIGTSRTKYINPRNVNASVHSYRGARLAELRQLVCEYKPKKLDTVVLVAGFNDNRSSPRKFYDDWKLLIEEIYRKFSPF